MVGRAVGAQAAVLALVLAGGVARVATYDAVPAERLVSFSTASTAVHKASSMRFEMTVDTTVAGNTVTLTMSGATDLVTKRAALTMDLSAVGRGSVRMVGEGNTGWVEVPASSLSLTGGRHWVRFDAPGGAAESAGGDPSAMLDRLAKLGDQVPREVGRDTVRDVATTRYHLDLTLDQIAGMAPAEQAQALRDAGAGSVVAGTDVWIGDDGLPRRVEMDMNMETVGVHLVTRGEMFGYGEPVHVDLPAASDSYLAGSVKEAMSIVGLPTP